ncbi:MAG: peptidase MA family metallohydrolase [Anaerolineae bacterium]
MSKFIQYLFIISGLLIFISTEPLSAQSTITTANEAVLIDFPDAITFEMDASGDASIEKATLIYGTNGRSCQNAGSKQPIEFDPGQNVSLEWEWELKRSGSLPPGAEIWWEWEIEDAEGNALTTERQKRLVEDERYLWRVVEDDGVFVNWVEGDQAFGESLLQIAGDSLDLISTDMGVPRPESVDLWVYPSSKDVQDALVYSAEWAGGVAFPDYGVTILGIAPDQEEWKSQVIPHELTHLVVGELMFNCYGVGLPTWLNEGLARYAESNIDERDLNQFQVALEAGELPPLKTLANGFSAYGGGASISYTQSYIIVKYLIDVYGPETMLSLLDTVKSGQRIDIALEDVYGFDTAGLDAEWRGTAGYAATPTLEADALAADATPTAVPTLSLVNPLSSPPTFTPIPPTVAPATAASEPTATAIPTDTPEPASTEVAPAEVAQVELENESEQALEVEPEETTPVEPSSNNMIWIVIGALFIGLFGSLIIYLRSRRS